MDENELHGRADNDKNGTIGSARVAQVTNATSALFRAIKEENVTVVARSLRDQTTDVNAQDADGRTPLMRAVAITNPVSARQIAAMLIKQNADVAAVDREGNTSLLLASVIGHLSLVTTLLDAGANVEHASTDGVTALVMASQSGHVHVVEKLLDAGAFVDNATNNGVTALMMASTHGHLPVVDKLLRAGACVDHATTYGVTALGMASQNEHFLVVHMLLRAGANVDHAGTDGVTALVMASQNDCFLVVCMLLHAGANVDHAARDGVTALGMASQNGHIHAVGMLLHAGANVDHATKDGVTALVMASQNGHFFVVQALLHAGAFVDNSTNNGVTALVMASQNDDFLVVHVLLHAGANVDHAATDGVTALVTASTHGHLLVVNELLHAGANVDHARTDGATALVMASTHGHLPVVDKLLHAGACVDHARTDGATALVMASTHGHLPVVDKLLHAGACVDHARTDGATALVMASTHGHLPVVDKLLHAGACVDHARTDGATALVMASTHGHLPVVDKLLRAGANVDLAPEDGMTALAVASQMGYASVVEKLVVAGSSVSSTNVKTGKTALAYAIENHHESVVYQLLGSETYFDPVDEDGCSPLMHASLNGDCAAVETLLRSGSCVHQWSSETGETALICASTNGHVVVVSTLLESGALANHSNHKTGDTPLICASSKGHSEVVEKLLAAGAHPCLPNSGEETPVSLAVQHDHVAVVCALVRHGADPSSITFDRQPLLHRVVAAGAERLSDIEYLLSRRDIDVNCIDEYGNSALRIAIINGDAAIVRLLLANGACVDDTSLALAAGDVRDELFRYNSDAYENVYNALAAASRTPPVTAVQAIVLLVTKVRDVEKLLGLIAKHKLRRSREIGVLVRSAFDHVLNMKLVLDDEECVAFINLVTTVNREWVDKTTATRYIFMATRVNVRGDLPARVDANTRQIMKVDGELRQLKHDIGVLQETLIDNQTMIQTLVAHIANHQRKYLLLLDELAHRTGALGQILYNRIEQIEGNLGQVVWGLQAFRREYVSRLEHEQRVKRIKTVCGLVASLAGPVAKEISHLLVDVVQAVDQSSPSLNLPTNVTDPLERLESAVQELLTITARESNVGDSEPDAEPTAAVDTEATADRVEAEPLAVATEGAGPSHSESALSPQTASGDEDAISAPADSIVTQAQSDQSQLDGLGTDQHENVDHRDGSEPAVTAGLSREHESVVDTAEAGKLPGDTTATTEGPDHDGSGLGEHGEVSETQALDADSEHADVDDDGVGEHDGADNQEDNASDDTALEEPNEDAVGFLQELVAWLEKLWRLLCAFWALLVSVLSLVVSVWMWRYAPSIRDLVGYAVAVLAISSFAWVSIRTPRPTARRK